MFPEIISLTIQKLSKFVPLIIRNILNEHTWIFSSDLVPKIGLGDSSSGKAFVPTQELEFRSSDLSEKLCGSVGPVHSACGHQGFLEQEG